MLEEDRSPGSEVFSALPIFPLPNAVLLPGMVLPLNVFEPRYLDLVDHVLEHGHHMGVPLLRPGFEPQYHARPAVEPVFGLGRVVSHERLADGRRFIRLEGVGRVRMIRELEPRHSFRELEVEDLPEEPPASLHELEVLKAQIERVMGSLGEAEEELAHCVLRLSDARVLVYAIAALLPGLDSNLGDGACDGLRRTVELQQRCLDARTSDDRVRLLLDRCAGLCDVLGQTGRFVLN